MRHVLADEMANILQPFVTPGGDVLSYPRANAVVVTDLESNVERLRQLAATFDIDGFRNLHARVFKMREGDPEELANELLTLLAPYGVTATGEGEGGVFMVPLQRLNAIVAFAVDQAAFSEIERWLMMLDIPPDKGAGRQTFVYNVENAKAADLAAVLNELFGGGEGGGGGAGAGRPGAPQPGGAGLFGAGGSTLEQRRASVGEAAWVASAAPAVGEGRQSAARRCRQRRHGPRWRRAAVRRRWRRWGRAGRRARAARWAAAPAASAARRPDARGSRRGGGLVEQHEHGRRRGWPAGAARAAGGRRRGCVAARRSRTRARAGGYDVRARCRSSARRSASSPTR